ncbi:hypothetical protein BN2475_580052 [Paraburkholderia ribeironis]|uniref:Uncharacterized protein n=1 Tax=Paraburkholderia ribeironis TaxID=1247936 RepID=A0A1N7SE94_9BURK|nr:hypothetical protein BN2475_580052 [Paraburkholderia ribeironis]
MRWMQRMPSEEPFEPRHQYVRLADQRAQTSVLKSMDELPLEAPYQLGPADAPLLHVSKFSQVVNFLDMKLG